ncbi:DUF4988 domain-containing protein [Parabacteroides faecis]|uniref:DUF4988 domain-containing protein n=1 Tax=Parabacteroides faecis TaxID=1217282 RepID=UPI0021642E4A|nr:DUF4988 domain-containing protein [Parabacteroides faecis]MCS2893340.1 DUF4988 domain-containing protein [Parabacteroides faecis]UVQ48054.1 DUF4988 domain-containing protein [Parabacteroides faecis]
MKKNFILFTSIFLLSATSCQKDLRDDVDDLLERVSKLEKICEQANADIVDLKQIVSLLEANDYITSVNELADKSGYAINFLKGNTIVVKHGTNGDYPVIGVDELDGIFYWTQKVGDNSASWVLDSNGNKVQATGGNGKTPVIGVNSSGNWTVDYGEGSKELLVNGKPVSAKGKDGQNGKDGVNGTDGKDGANGTNGKDGVDGYSPFKSVTDKGDYIELKLTTGTILKLPKENSKAMKILFDVNENGLITERMWADETKEITYKVENPDSQTTVDFEATNGWRVKHNRNNNSITLIPLEAWNEEGRIIVSLLKDNKLISQFRYSVKTMLFWDKSSINTMPQVLEAIGGKVPVTIQNIIFPPQWFYKNAVIKITPVLRYSGGEAKGLLYTFKGEDVEDIEEGDIITYETGANEAIRSSFDYIPEMNKSELYLTFDVEIDGRAVKIDDMKVADGVIATN